MPPYDPVNFPVPNDYNKGNQLADLQTSPDAPLNSPEDNSIFYEIELLGCLPPDFVDNPLNENEKDF